MEMDVNLSILILLFPSHSEVQTPSENPISRVDPSSPLIPFTVSNILINGVLASAYSEPRWHMNYTQLFHEVCNKKYLPCTVRGLGPQTQNQTFMHFTEPPHGYSS